LVGSQDLRPLAVSDNQMLALRSVSGEMVWSYPTQAHSLSAPAIWENRIFFTTNNNQGICLSIEDGRLLWQVDELPSWNGSPPTSGEGKFYFSTRTGGIIAVNSKDGVVENFFQAGTPFLSTPVYHEGLLVADCGDKHLYAIDTQTKEMAWRVSLSRGSSSPPSVAGPMVMIGVKDTFEGHPSYGLRVFDLNSGETLYQVPSKKHILVPSMVIGDKALAGNRDGQLHMIELKTGNIVWSFKGEDSVMSQPAVFDETIFFGTRDGQVYAIKKEQPVVLEHRDAEAYRQSGNWEKAGIAAALNKDYEAAAQDYLRIDQPYQAAQLYEKAGMWSQAAANYLSAGKMDKAIALYRQAGDQEGEAEALCREKRFEEAAVLYGDLEQFDKAARAYERAGRMNRAAACHTLGGNLQRASEIYLAINKPDAAAQVYKDAGDKETAAKIYERAEKWTRAAELWMESKKLNLAAEMYRRAGQLRQAAQLYEKAEDRQAAVTFYLQMEDAVALVRLGDWESAAAIYTDMKPPMILEAARCYERAEKWAEAAVIYLEQEYPEKAAACWILAGHRDKAQEIIPGLELSPEKAELLERIEDFDEAVEIWIELGETAEAVRLYRQTGQVHQAFELLYEQEAWEPLRLLAKDFDAPEQEARAILQLAEEAEWQEQIAYYRDAADALAKAVRQFEAIQSKSEESLAELWEEISGLYEEALEQELAINSFKEAQRLRRLPEIAVRITADRELVAQEWQILEVSVVNVGFGPAGFIAIRVKSDLFEGDDMHTHDLGGLLPQRSRSLYLRVLPKEKAVGDAVPMDFEIDYVLPDGEKFRRRIRGEVAVKRFTSQSKTPSEQAVDALRSGRGPLVHIYRDVTHTFDQIDSQSTTSEGMDPEELRNRRFLRDQIIKHFNDNELRDLCFNMGIPYDHLEGGQTVPAKARSLVERCIRENRVGELRKQCREMRPFIDWDDND